VQVPPVAALQLPLPLHAVHFDELQRLLAQFWSLPLVHVALVARRHALELAPTQVPAEQSADVAHVERQELPLQL
jgi:hypothetical protein